MKRIMTTNIRLLRTPRPFSDESLRGLIVRATEENNYDTSSLLLSLANVIVDSKTKRTLYTEQRWKNLSEMLNIEIPKLQDLACLLGIEGVPPKAYNMFGHRIHKYSVRTTAPKICPGCLHDSNYIRKIWDLAAFTCCPKHRTLLIEKCPKCGQRISWDRNKVSMCECGQDWTEVDLPEVLEIETVLSHLILRVCGLMKSDEAEVGRKDGESPEGKPLFAVGLSEMLCAVYFIAGQQHGVVDSTGKQYAVRLSHDELHKTLTDAVKVFENWPKNYFEFLEEHKGKNTCSERNSGLYKDFGKLYDPLFIRKNNPLPQFMREAFKQYITTKWDGGYAGWCESISKEDLQRKKYMTKHETMKHLKVSLHTVNILYNKGYLKGNFYPWINRSRVAIEAESVRELKYRWNKSINAVQAGEMLGIGRIAVVSLVKKGCLAAIQGPAVTGQLEWKFEVPVVKELLQQVEKKISQRKEEIVTPHISFHNAIQRLSKLSLDVGAFIKLILDDKIAPIARGNGIGLSALLFSAGEIKQFSRDETVKRRGNIHTMQEAARLLRTSSNEVVFLVKRGFLSATKNSKGRGGTWEIAQEEIDQFNNNYSTVSYIVDALGTSCKGVFERLMANGIIPVTGPKIDGGEVYFFRKADLEAADFSVFLPKARKSTIQKMNDKGLISKKQLTDIAGFPVTWVNKVLEKGWIAPVKTHKHIDGDTTPFFSQKQIRKFEELMAKEKHQLILCGNKQVDKQAAA